MTEYGVEANIDELRQRNFNKTSKTPRKCYFHREQRLGYKIGKSAKTLGIFPLPVLLEAVVKKEKICDWKKRHRPLSVGMKRKRLNAKLRIYYGWSEFFFRKLKILKWHDY